MSTVLPFDFGSGYQVIRKIGQGASGRVFEGIDRVHGDRVAIKILRSDLDDDAQLVQRFVNERRALTELEHPRIISVRDLIVDQGMLGIVMELATGPTLGEQLAANGPMAPAAGLAVVGRGERDDADLHHAFQLKSDEYPHRHHRRQVGERSAHGSLFGRSVHHSGRPRRECSASGFVQHRCRDRELSGAGEPDHHCCWWIVTRPAET